MVNQVEKAVRLIWVTGNLQWPTPLAELPRLSDHLGVQICIKRDDLTGLALGGNKTRKLETILGAALQQGCNAVITAGAAQSNHCRQTAAAAAMLGLQCHLVLGGEKPDSQQGNLLLDQLFDAHIHWAGENRKGEDIPQLFERLVSSGLKPYIVPYGGSNPLGALGYVDAMHELAAQTEHQFDYLLFASSSGGTHAGLVLGNALEKRANKVIGINIDKLEAEGGFIEFITDLANQTAELANLKHRLARNDILLNSDYLGAGYGVVGDAEREAIKLMASLEGILVDPVYSGRALAGLIGMIGSGEIEQGSSVLFWHTGGAPALFAYADSLDVPIT